MDYYCKYVISLSNLRANINVSNQTNIKNSMYVNIWN